MNQQLDNYIKQAKRAKMTDGQIKQDLSKAGWPEKDVEQALSAGGKKSKSSAWLIVLVIIIVLAAAGYAAWWYNLLPDYVWPSNWGIF
jgi:hypothetical protein